MEENNNWKELIGKTIKNICIVLADEGADIECTDGTKFFIVIDKAKLYCGKDS